MSVGHKMFAQEFGGLLAKICGLVMRIKCMSARIQCQVPRIKKHQNPVAVWPEYSGLYFRIQLPGGNDRLARLPESSGLVGKSYGLVARLDWLFFLLFSETQRH